MRGLEGKNREFASDLQKKYKVKICQGFRMDIGDSGSIENGIRKIYEETGRLDVVINNAVYTVSGAMHSMKNTDWERAIDGTINATFRVSKVAMEYMLKQKQGHIINIASMYGIVAPNWKNYESIEAVNPANYGAGKAAVIQFTKYIAAVYGNQGIRANAISPGAYPDENVQRENKEFVDKLKNNTPIMRIGIPKDLQGMIVYLSSDASSYVTGQNFVIDGGWSIW